MDNKTSCIDCGIKISRKAKRCVKCSGITRRKSVFVLLINKRRAARDWSRKRDSELKRLIFIKLGDKCVRCGFSDPRALHVDHVNDDGYVERKNMNRYRRTLSILKDQKGRYQILCANCNFIKMNEALIRRETEKRAREKYAKSSRTDCSSGLENISKSRVGNEQPAGGGAQVPPGPAQ